MKPDADAPGYEPERAVRKAMGPLFGMACLGATISGVVVLTILLGSVIVTFLKGTRGAELELIASVNAPEELPEKGRFRIVLGRRDGSLLLRYFDHDGDVAEDFDESQLTKKGEQVADLKTRLDPLWPPHELTNAERVAVVDSVAAILDKPDLKDRPAFELLSRIARSMQDSDPDLAGFRAGIVGSLWLLGLVGVFSIPVGVSAAVFLEEYTPPGRLRRIVQVNIANLAGVPSIVYGILGLSLFVRAFGYNKLALRESLWAGGLTLALLILPVIVIATQEALRTVPGSLRQAAMALGATRWQVVRDHVIPSAMPGILTGMILALSRAIGETAPLLMVGASASILFLPKGPSDRYTALPVEIYNYAKEANRRFEPVAAGGILVLLALLLTMNATAIVIRNRYARSSRG